MLQVFVFRADLERVVLKAYLEEEGVGNPDDQHDPAQHVLLYLLQAVQNKADLLFLSEELLVQAVLCRQDGGVVVASQQLKQFILFPLNFDEFGDGHK